jgi:hypothetical protein
MNRVFVVQEQPHMNISPATEFGPLIFLMGPGEHAFNPTRVVNTMREVIEEQNFTSSDHLLLIGDPVLIGCAVAITDQWMQGKNPGSDPQPKLKILKWDRELRRYLPIELPLAE